MINASRRLCIDAMRGFMLWNNFLTDALVIALAQVPHSGIVESLLRNYQHADWNGYSYIDAGFPGYMAIIGASITLSYERRRQQGTTKWQYFIHILLRAVLLWICAFFGEGGFSIHYYDINFGTIFFELAVCILFTGILLLIIPPRWLPLVLVAWLCAHWAALEFIQVPGFGHGNFSKEGNAENYLQSKMSDYFATAFDWQGPYRRLANGMAYGCITPRLIGTCLIGLILGQILVSKNSVQRQVLILAVVGSIAMVGAWIWDGWLPMNKHLWTPSFVVFSGGFAYVVMGAFIQLVEVWNCQKFATIFTVFGRTPLLAWFCFFYALPFTDLAKRFFGPGLPLFGAYHPLVLAIMPVILCWLFFYWLHRRKIIE